MADGSSVVRRLGMLGALWYSRDVDGTCGSVDALDIEIGSMSAGLYGIRFIGDGGNDAQLFSLLRR